MTPKDREALWDAKVEEVGAYWAGRVEAMDPEIIEPVAAMQILGIPTVSSCGGHVVPPWSPERHKTVMDAIAAGEDAAVRANWIEKPGIPHIVCGRHAGPYEKYANEEGFGKFIRGEFSPGEKAYLTRVIRENQTYRDRMNDALDALYRERRPAVASSQRLRIDTQYEWYYGTFTVTPAERQLDFSMPQDRLAALVENGRHEFNAFTAMVKRRFLLGRYDEFIGVELPNRP